MATQPLRPLPIVNDAIAPADAQATPPAPADGRECVDPGAGNSRTLVGVFNPTTQKQALAQALGMNALERSKALRGTFLINVAAVPDVLKLDVQKKFTIKNFGQDLDGSWTVEEILILFGDVLEMKIWAFKEDAGAAPPQIFGTDAAAFFPPPPTPEPVAPQEINAPTIAPESPGAKDLAAIAPEFHQLPNLPIPESEIGQFKIEGFKEAGNFTLTDWSAGSFGGGQTLWNSETKEAIASKQNKFSASELPAELVALESI